MIRRVWRWAEAKDARPISRHIRGSTRRREMVRGRVLGIVGLGAVAAAGIWLRPAASAVNQVDQLAPGVYFHEGDLDGKGHCNNGWIVFDDYMLVVDANFPSGAETVYPKIRTTTDRPVRFAFDTNHHGDHAYGNQFWVD